MTEHNAPAPDEAMLQSQLETTKKDLEVALKRAEENLDGWKRAKADYINLKRDSEKMGGELAQFAVAAMVLDLLPVADNLDRAVQHLPDDLTSNDWAKGILGIRDQLTQMLKNAGIEAVSTEGEFNPEFHEAIGHEKKEGVNPGSITEVLERGYTVNGKLLRPAKVKVAK